LAVFQVFFVAISYSRFEDAVSLTGIQAENFFLNIVIAIVTALKALVTGMSYFRQNRNCVDTAVNIIALAGDFSALSGSPQFVSDGIRLVQLARLYRLAFLQREIMVLLRTLSSSIKNFTVTSFVLMAVVFQFAFVGQVLFGRVKWTTRSGLCKFSNFDRFDVAVYTLVRVGVGAAGLTLMETNCAISPPDCDPNLGDCGWPIVAPLFKIVFMVFVNWIGVNLVSAVLLEGLSNSERQESFAIKPEDVDDFGHMWKAVAVYDRSKGSVTFRELWSLLLRLQRSSLGVEGKNPLHVALRLGRLPLRKLRKSEGRGGGQPVIFKRHVFHGLVDSLYGVELPRRHKRELERILESRFRDVEQEKQLVAEEATLDTLAAALTIQRLFRSSRKKGERDSSRAAANRRSE
jgi:hypothetical protein